MIDTFTAYTMARPSQTVYAAPLVVSLTRRDLTELPDLGPDGELANIGFRGAEGKADLYGMACLLSSAMTHAGLGHRDTAFEYVLAAAYMMAELADRADAGEQVRS